jgi:hypothetical protein
MMLLVRARRQLRNDASTQNKPAATMPGGRKINATNRRFADMMQVDITVANVEMMRIGENINAKYPPYATVAPILQGCVRGNPTDRGTTSNTGAADADGR